MTVTVLIAAGLLLRSFAALRSVDLGFDHARLFTAQVVLPEARYRTRGRLHTLCPSVDRALEDHPRSGTGGRDELAAAGVQRAHERAV